jgi:CheY-like chemotaxis protein
MAACTGAVLIVEDSLDDAKALEVVLEQTGIRNPIEVFDRVSDVIARLNYAMNHPDSSKTPPVSVILVDLKMPGIDGFQLLDWLNMQPELSEALVVVVSGLDNLASIRRAYALGADSFLTKPCTLSDLENLVHWFPEYWDRTATAVPKTDVTA